MYGGCERGSQSQGFPAFLQGPVVFRYKSETYKPQQLLTSIQGAHRCPGDITAEAYTRTNTQAVMCEWEGSVDLLHKAHEGAESINLADSQADYHPHWPD